MKNREGFRCLVPGCPKANNRLFSVDGMRMHLLDEHSIKFTKKDKEKVRRKFVWIEEDAEEKQARKIKMITFIEREKKKLRSRTVT